MTDRPRITMRAPVLGRSAPPEIELPSVKELPAYLETIDSVDQLHALQRADTRHTAAAHYERRINELTAAPEPEE